MVSARGGWKFRPRLAAIRAVLFLRASLLAMRLGVLSEALVYRHAAPVRLRLPEWALVEYVLHRFAFHYLAESASFGRFFSAPHRLHHEHPQAVEQLFTGLKMSVPVALIYCLLGWLILGGWQEMSYLFTGLVAGYLATWLQYRAHQARPACVLQVSEEVTTDSPSSTPDRARVTVAARRLLCGTFARITCATGERRIRPDKVKQTNTPRASCPLRCSTRWDIRRQLSYRGSYARRQIILTPL